MGRFLTLLSIMVHIFKMAAVSYNVLCSLDLSENSRLPRGLRRRFTCACLMGLRMSTHGCYSVVSAVCVVRKRSLRWADHSSRGVLQNMECLCVISKS